MKKITFAFLFFISLISFSQQHLFYGAQLDYGPFFRSFDQSREVLRGSRLGRMINVGVSGSYRIMDKFTLEGGARLNGMKWRLRDLDFEERNPGFEAVQATHNRFLSFYGSAKYSYYLGHKKYAFFRLGYEHTRIISDVLTETRNFTAGTDSIRSSITYGNTNNAITPEIGYEFFNRNGNLITLGLKYHHKFSGDDLLSWAYSTDNRADNNRLITNDNIRISGSYVALTLQFNGLLSYKTKKERIPKKKKKDPVLVEQPKEEIEAVDTTPVVVTNEEVINDRDYNVTHKVKVKSETVKIIIWDHQLEDGDRVNLILNNDMILNDYTLKNKKLELEVTLEEGKNEFILYALNLGKYKPNTAAIIIDDGIKQHKMVLESTLNESGAIEIKYEK